MCVANEKDASPRRMVQKSNCIGSLKTPKSFAQSMECLSSLLLSKRPLGDTTIYCTYDRAVQADISDTSEKPSGGGPSGGFVPGEPYDERAQETQDLLGILYFIVEVLRSDETFGDELSTCYS